MTSNLLAAVRPAKRMEPDVKSQIKEPDVKSQIKAEPKPVGPPDASALEGPLRLAAGKTDEEKFLGLALALRQPAILTSDPKLRKRLLEIVGDGAFLQRLLTSSTPCQRVALATLRMLVMDAEAAESLIGCVLPLARAWENATDSTSEMIKGAEQEAAWGHTESQEAAEALRQFARFKVIEDPLLEGKEKPRLEEKEKPWLEEAVPHIRNAIQSLSKESNDQEPLLMDAILELLQELCAERWRLWNAIPDGFLEGFSLPLLREKSTGGRVFLALGLLSERLEAGVASEGEQLGDILDASLAAGSGDHSASSTAMSRAVALRLAAAALSMKGKPKALAKARLLPVLSLSIVEVRLALETTEPGEASLQALCGACMCMETAVSALADMADDGENESQSAREAHTCLGALHRALAEVFDFCEHLPKGDDAPPPQLAMIARAVGAYQAEEPMKFAPEFRRSLEVFCKLPHAEFTVLLPGIQALSDWHLTPALGKLFEALKWASDPFGDGTPSTEFSFEKGDELLQAWRQAALMLTEVCLDPAAYLPEAPLAPITVGEDVTQSNSDHGSSAMHGIVTPWPRGLPRPAVAADPAHPGVQQLISWTQVLWSQGIPHHSCPPADNWLLATLCSALHISAPAAALTHVDKSMYDVVAKNLIPGPTPQDDNPLWRLSLRFCAFALDRNPAVAGALLAAAQARSTRGLPKFAPPPVWAAIFASDGDEWAEDDEAAVNYLRAFIGE
eukprot:gnl/MRDRNA2_/MRDRNA2_86227_c0_seq3.p1 gnl/MRDRNA2_/MRDRNA2_86227_c0~~gnl/MRDRNA2_/MRDRNA2_86227_c0_seq3.p1  ORF type:complete len:756 (+),score=160.06 gnl/MRDRNA2_/MRDRNA2_86227_c0_seq3:68-2269(+)